MGIIENVPPPPFTARQEWTYRLQVEALTREGLPHAKVVSILVQVVSASGGLKPHQVFAWFVRESRAIRSDQIETARVDVRRALNASDYEKARACMKTLKMLERGRGRD